MTEEDAVVLREVGERAELRLRAARPPRDRHRARPDRHGGRRPGVSGSRFAYLKGDLVLLELALVRFAIDARPRRGPRAGRPAGPGPRRGAGRDRLPARRPRPDLRDPQGRALPRRHLRGARSPACTPTRSSTPTELPLRYARLLDLLPPRGRRRRPRHPRHLPRPPVRQGRDVLVRRARRESAAEHERLLAIEERILGRARDPLPGRQRRRRRPRRPGGEEVRLRGLDPEPGAATAS